MTTNFMHSTVYIHSIILISLIKLFSYYSFFKIYVLSVKQDIFYMKILAILHVQIDIMKIPLIGNAVPAILRVPHVRAPL